MVSRVRGWVSRVRSLVSRVRSLVFRVSGVVSRVRVWVLTIQDSEFSAQGLGNVGDVTLNPKPLGSVLSFPP